MNTKLIGRGAHVRLLVVGCLLAMFAMAVPVDAAGVVGNGTAASCTETALTTAVGSGAGIVTFNCGTNPVTIKLNGTLQVAFNMTIDGGNKITLSGGDNGSFVQVFSAKTVALKNLTFTHFRSSSAALQNFGTTTATSVRFVNNTSLASGGAIQNFGTLTLVSCTFTSNVATNGDGGALINDGALTLTSTIVQNNVALVGGSGGGNGGGVMNSSGTTKVNSSSILNNMAYLDGGGIYNATGATLSVNSGTLIGNRALGVGSFSRGGGIALQSGGMQASIMIMRNNDARDGGGLYNGGGVAVTVSRAEFAGNTASDGAAIYMSGGTLTLRNSTLSGNSADGRGGGIFASSGTATVVNATINLNSADSVNTGGGGIYNIEGSVRLKDTIVSNSITGKNCTGNAVTTLGFNISSDATCNLTAASDKLSTNPLLGVLTNNGGVGLITRTHLPASNSPAVDKGSACPAPDQRGFVRLIGPACDIGAVETGSHP